MPNLLAGREPLTDAERQRLGSFLRGLKNPGRLTLEGLDGLFCALIAGPETVMPGVPARGVGRFKMREPARAWIIQRCINAATLPPTPIPDAPTPEPSLTPTSSPTPLPRFFTEQFDSSLVGWVTLQAGNEATPNLTTKDSALRLQVDSPFAWFYALYSPEEYDNVHIETKFVSSALSPASIGLVCRYSETDGWLEANVSTDGTYNILFWSLALCRRCGLPSHPRRCF